jgi:hypothetical protein
MTLTPLERGLEIFALIHLALMGLSHIVQHRAWAEFFILLRGRRQAGVFIHGFLSLGFGGMIVGFHRVWWGLPLVLSAVGVLYVLKSLHGFALPSAALRSLNRVSIEGSRVFIGAGVVFLLIAGVTALSLVRNG